jgi:hypothetical protein
VESLEASVEVELSTGTSSADETASLVPFFVALVEVGRSSVEAGDSCTALEVLSATVDVVEVDS